MSKVSKDLDSSQDAKNAQNSKRDEVLKRMLRMKPQPHGNKSRKAQLDLADSETFADSKESSDISDRNRSGKATDRSED
jgi:hypothetical protein